MAIAEALLLVLSARATVWVPSPLVSSRVLANELCRLRDRGEIGLYCEHIKAGDRLFPVWCIWLAQKT